MLPAVTIAIVFYNAEKSILNSVKSVFAQTHNNWELILIDDGSTDSSLNMIKNISDSRVRIYSDGKNKKLASRLNQVVMLAKYDFIARMDADDLMSKNRIKEQLEVIMQNKDVDLVSTGILSITNNLKPVGIRTARYGHKINPEEVLLGRSGMVHASILGRKSWFIRNPYDESYGIGQDIKLWIESCGKNDLQVYFIAKPLYFYCEDDNVTYQKLILGYDAYRRAIIEGRRYFGTRVVIKAYVISLIKQLAVNVLYGFDLLNVLRNKRNKRKLSELQKEKYEKEIAYITSQDVFK